MENIGNSRVSKNRITSKYTYLGNSPEFRVVLEPCERILTPDILGPALELTPFASDFQYSGTPVQSSVSLVSQFRLG